MKQNQAPQPPKATLYIHLGRCLRSQMPQRGATAVAIRFNGWEMTRSQMPRRGTTMVASRFNGWEMARSQMPQRGTTMVASRFNGWETTAEKRMRAVGTRPNTRRGRVPKGTPAAANHPLPAIEMAGYPCQMPTASAQRSGWGTTNSCWGTTRSQMPQRGTTMVASRFNGWEATAKKGMRAVGTRPNTRHGRVPKGTLTADAASVPAIEMAGYPCQMPTASAPRSSWGTTHFGWEATRSQMPQRGAIAVASQFIGWGMTRGQLPQRGTTMVASRFNGWEATAKKGMRAVGTRQ